MKKNIVFVVVLLTSLMLSGCSNKVTNEPETTVQSTGITVESTEAPSDPTEASTTSDQNIIDAFKAMADSEAVDLVKMSIYLKDNIGNVSDENSDLMLQIYEKIQMQVLPAYQDAFLVESIQSILLTYSIKDLQQSQVKEEPVLALLTEAIAVGYKIEAIEGTVAPYVDYGYFAQYANYTTEPTGAFYTLMKTESDNPPQKDAALIIPWEDVLQRGIDFEAYLEAYPGSIYEERGRMHLDGYKNLAINGSANVPLFEYDTNVMNSAAKTAYTEFVDQGLQTEFAMLIRTYVSLLETHAFVKTAEVEAFISEQN